MALASRIFRVSLAVFLAIFVTVSGLSEAATLSRQYQYAAQLFGDSGESWSRLASSFSAAGEDEKAAEAAKKALQYSLGHVKALRALGIASFRGGEEEKGRKLVKLAGELSWRDGPAQSWLFQQALLQGDYADAMLHADALLRREKVQDEIFGVFNLAAMDKRLIGLLIRQFENNPNWRTRYFAYGKQVPSDQYRGFENIVEALQPGDTPVSRDELSFYANMLIGKKQFGRALALWNRYFPGRKEGGFAILIWPESADTSRPKPDDWRLASNRDVTAMINPGDGNERILEIDLGRGARGELAWRYMPARIGKMTLRLQDYYGNRGDIEGIRWTATCMSGGEKRYFVRSDQDQFVWQIDFVSGCGPYKLGLELKLGGLSGAKSLRLPPVRITN